MAIRDGQVFGNYRVLSRIGIGGMGAVYLAEHPLIGKRVALKVIHEELSGNREIIQRFFQEARAVTQIGSEHIVEIHDFGQTPEGQYFFIMEYLDGINLADLLAREGALTVQRALQIGAQIASGLSAAHQRGIIHRDLKPDNIMLIQRMGERDFVKVLDFGLAKSFAEGGGNQITARGVVLGTPQYMAPEACEGKEPVDYRADIYALGLLVYQMLTGRVPFDGATMGEILVKQVIHAPPALRGINPNIPPAVEQVVLRCLAKQPSGRFASMEALRSALLDPDRYLASSPPIMPSAPVSEEMQRAGVATAPTAILDGPMDAAQPVPFVAVPVIPENRTMRIATPPGYRRERRWAVVVAVASTLIVIGVIVAVLMADSDSPAVVLPGIDAAPAAARVPEHPGDAGAMGVPVAARAHDAGADTAKRTVQLTIRTQPEGAEIIAIADKASGPVVLGVTPTTIELPHGSGEHILLFRHPDAKEHRKVVSAADDAEISVELELLPKRPAVEPTPPRKKNDNTRRPNSDLMVPNF